MHGFDYSEFTNTDSDLTRANLISGGVYNGFNLFNTAFMEEIVKMAQDISNAHKTGNEMGLNDEELAFYDALTKPEAIKDLYTNDQLIAITRELTEALRTSRTVDWEKKESARAGMRRMIKRLLKKYKYPPEGMEYAIKTVISQCEMWVDVDIYSTNDGVSASKRTMAYYNALKTGQ